MENIWWNRLEQKGVKAEPYSTETVLDVKLDFNDTLFAFVKSDAVICAESKPSCRKDEVNLIASRDL